MKLELDKIKGLLAQAPAFSIAFDTTAEIAELFALVVRVVSSSFIIEHRCFSFRMLAKALSGNETCALLIQLLAVEAGLPLDKMHYTARDGAPVNGAATAQLQTLNPRLVDMTCLSHSINVSGKQFCQTCPHANTVIHKWAELGGNSFRTRREFHAQTNAKFQHLSKTRWFCWVEVGVQLYDFFEDVVLVLHDEGIGCPELRTALLHYIEENHLEVCSELALIVDSGKCLAKACYEFEGDGFLAPFAFDSMAALLRDGERFTGRGEYNEAIPDLPTVLEAVQMLIPNAGEEAQRHLLRLTAQKAEGPFDKLRYDTTHRLQSDMLTYRACRLLQPMFVANNTLDATTEELVHLNSLPHLQQYAAALALELPAYHAAAAAADWQEQPHSHAAWAFWRRNSLRLPHWARAAKEVALVMTSSGSVERVFSVYESVFNEQQDMALEDRRAASVMIRYNRAKERKSAGNNNN